MLFRSEAARNLDFERAAKMRDDLKKLKQRLIIGLEIVQGAA